jgi:hypothetical protein
VLSFLFSVFGFLKGPLAKLGDQIVEAKRNQLATENDWERLVLDERLGQLKARRDVLLAEATSPINTWIRVLFALPFTIYLWKLIVWDKVLGWGATDGLSSTLDGIMWTVIGFYFLDTAIRRFRGRR